LKKSILHRKNSLLHKTRNRARVGDLFMSLIHTCELTNPITFLSKLPRLAKLFQAALYARVSSNDQQTLSMQNRANQEYAA
jgi:hypothetical protein